MEGKIVVVVDDFASRWSGATKALELEGGVLLGDPFSIHLAF